jgi:hypothetical protein
MHYHHVGGRDASASQKKDQKMFSAPFLSTLLHRVKAVVRRVVRPGVVRARSEAADAAGAVSTGGPISPVMRGRMQGWLSTKLRTLSALMRRIEAGAVLQAPVAASRAVTSGVDASAARVSVPPEERLPRGFGWMCAFGPDVRGDGRAFVEWLNEPAMRAKVMAAPEEMARVLSPILNATGEARPAWFPDLPKRVRRRRVRAGQCLAGPRVASEPVVSPPAADVRALPLTPDGREVVGGTLVMAAVAPARPSWLRNGGFSKMRLGLPRDLHEYIVTIS